MFYNGSLVTLFFLLNTTKAVYNMLLLYCFSTAALALHKALKVMMTILQEQQHSNNSKTSATTTLSILHTSEMRCVRILCISAAYQIQGNCETIKNITWFRD